MKIFDAKQIYAADSFTIQKQQITSDELMERASLQLFHWLHQRMQGAPVKIHLFCGIGNNGGDGLALARHLQEHGYHIEVNIVNYSEKRSPDFLTNLDRLKARKIWPNILNGDSAFPSIGVDDIIVDAIFGIGLNRSPAPWVVDLMKNLKATGAFILSVDVPSGLFMDRGIEDPEFAVEADFVLSFQAPKLVFFLPETARYIKQWDVLDIGLDPEFLEKTETTYKLMGKAEVLPLYRPRQKFSHKGHYGHALILGGSYGKIGAVILSTSACLRVGAGLVTAYVPQCGLLPLQIACPEAMVLTDKGEKYISQIEFDLEPSAVGAGIGLGTEKETVSALSAFLDAQKSAMVLDADALNILSQNRKLLDKIPEGSILTPHPKELERLLGSWKDDFEKLQKTREFSVNHRCIIVIKGAHTTICAGEKCYINNNGNPGMATAGSGDVLTGFITGLLSQGYEPLAAAIFGVFLHGMAGDLAATEQGFEALTANSIIDFIGKAYIELLRPPQTQEQQTEETEA
ncbi:NAD(P)H-hydrate dehydratase [Poritiphilus flavus]|uniref:Bifunctional NAD(P)H-hydrate repair enzyme n=1 Tax=Poritiphilus flavus TaxID=2697053 RepID=A0A6L9EBJ4_9FLAO|nr:NAD(P)H-hydrate dehydratase [Poritiphilus flavus]NAS12117.1 NAD(P)H-hydrate dehydratase [Poritiphilus flavus]